MDLREIESEVMNGIPLVQNRVQRLALVDKVVNRLVP
jgi:hypothetical protein